MPEGIYRRGTKGTWYGRKEIGGKDRRCSLRTTSRTEARRRYERWVAELDHEQHYGDERQRWMDAIAKWTTEYLPDNVKPKVAERYKVSIRQIERYLRDLYVDQIDQRKIAGIVSQRKRDKVANATIKRDLTALSSLLRYCVVMGWSDQNAAKFFDRSIIRERRDPFKKPTERQIGSVLGNLPFMLAQMSKLSRQTGMRLSECATLEYDQIKSDKQILLTETKSNNPRVIPLKGHRLLEQAPGTISGTPQHLHSKFVFWHHDGQPYLNASNQFRLAAVEADYPGSFHGFRHMFAIEYLELDGGLYTLQQILGHESIKTTEGYLRYLTPEQAERAKNKPAQNPAHA